MFGLSSKYRKELQSGKAALIGPEKNVKTKSTEMKISTCRYIRTHMFAASYDSVSKSQRVLAIFMSTASASAAAAGGESIRAKTDVTKNNNNNYSRQAGKLDKTFLLSCPACLFT